MPSEPLVLARFARRATVVPAVELALLCASSAALAGEPVLRQFDRRVIERAVEQPPPPPGPPVNAPHDLVIGRIQLLQDDQPITRPRVGKQITIQCTYFVNADPSPLRQMQPWEGAVLGGGDFTRTFPGELGPGQHAARVQWTPTAPGRTPMRCILNRSFSSAEANPDNNATDEIITVLEGGVACPTALQAEVLAAVEGAAPPERVPLSLRLAASSPTPAVVECRYESPNGDVRGVVVRYPCPGASTGTAPHTYLCGG